MFVWVPNWLRPKYKYTACEKGVISVCGVGVRLDKLPSSFYHFTFFPVPHIFGNFEILVGFSNKAVWVTTMLGHAACISIDGPSGRSSGVEELKSDSHIRLSFLQKTWLSSGKEIKVSLCAQQPSLLSRELCSRVILHLHIQSGTKKPPKKHQESVPVSHVIKTIS